MKIKLIKKADYPGTEKFGENFEIGKTGEICVAIGGDGTFIKASKEFDGPILPIRSKEKGSIGYYSDLSVDDIDYAISMLKKKRYFIERLGNKVELTYKGRRMYPVNEVVMNNTTTEVSFKVYSSDRRKREEIYPFVMSGDGVLVTSSVGSTAYNKSAGGPIILNPDVLCITFLNVDGPYSNPIVVGADKIIEIEVRKSKGILSYDGTKLGVLAEGDTFSVKLSKKPIQVIRFGGRREDFGAKLERIIQSRMQK